MTDHEYIKYNTFPHPVVEPIYERNYSMANTGTQHLIENPCRQTQGSAQVQWSQRGLVPVGTSNPVQLFTSQTRGETLYEKFLPKLEIQNPTYPQAVQNQSQRYHPAFNHQVNNNFGGFPPAMMHQYQALAPGLLQVVPDREAPCYSLPGCIPVGFSGQSGLIPPATVNQATVFQAVQGGFSAYSAPVILSAMQQSKPRFFPVDGAGSAHQYAQPPMPNLSKVRGDSFSQPIMQVVAHSSDASSQESLDEAMNPSQRSSSNHLMALGRGITKGNMYQRHSFQVHDDKGDQSRNEPSQHNRQSGRVRCLFGHERVNGEINNGRNVDQQMYDGSLHQTAPLLQNVGDWQRFGVGNIDYSRKEWRYDSDRWATVSALCHALEQMCCMNNRRRNTKTPPVMPGFHAATVPAIPLASFLKRIAWFFDCSKECFVLALEYIHRLMKYKREVEVNYNNVHNLILTCINIAAKFIDDKVFRNKFYARVVGVPVATVSALEVRFLFLLGFDLYVLPAQYQTRYKAMLIENQGPSKVTIDPEGNRKN